MSMFDNIKFPFLTHQQLNLDWILAEIKRIIGFLPEEGDPGTVLMKTEEGASWEELPAIDININGVPEDTELSDTDKLIFYDISASANRKITAPNLLNSMMSNGTPLMDGTGSAGTSKKPARYDHRHPTDTSRQAALSGVQMNAVNSGAHANSFDSNGVLKFANGGLNDSGVSESGVHYCKMPDGTLIQWGEIAVTDVAIANAWGSLYESVSQQSGVVFPIAFVGSPSVIAFASTTPTSWLENMGYDSTRLGTYYLVRATSTATTSGFISWIAIGRWK